MRKKACRLGPAGSVPVRHGDDPNIGAATPRILVETAEIAEAGYGNVNILEQVEPDLLGGLVVRIGARLYDTSLKSRLQRLQYAMKGAA